MIRVFVVFGIVASCFELSIETPAYAVPLPLHAYEFKGSLSDSGTGGTAITSEGGSVGSEFYEFDPKQPPDGDANEGLTLHNGQLSNWGVYSIEMYLTYDSVSNISTTTPPYWLKLVDYKNAAYSLGMYYEDMAFSTRFETPPATPGVSSLIKHAYGPELGQPLVKQSNGPVMFGGDWLHIVNIRDATGTIKTYVNGEEVYSFVDVPAENDFVFYDPVKNPTSIMRFLQTDSGAFDWEYYEVGKGAIDFLRIYDEALSAADVSALASLVPEPSAAMLAVVVGMSLLNRRVRRRPACA